MISDFLIMWAVVFAGACALDGVTWLVTRALRMWG